MNSRSSQRFCRVYRGKVTRADDPQGRRRAMVNVPAVDPTADHWALPCLRAETRSASQGGPVWVMYEQGDADRPVWMDRNPTRELSGPRTGLGCGIYRVRVRSTEDPTSQGRIKVEVPGLGRGSGSWAATVSGTKSSGVSRGAVGWVVFEGGDPDRPVWVGRASRMGRAPSRKPESRARADRSRTRTHVVERGESLSAIAWKYYGDGDEWRQIWEANRRTIGPDPNLITPGQELTIPPRG